LQRRTARDMREIDLRLSHRHATINGERNRSLQETRRSIRSVQSETMKHILFRIRSDKGAKGINCHVNTCNITFLLLKVKVFSP
jgi:hypothetical protein